MLNIILSRAAENIRGAYAIDCLYGRQKWSGSDLRGNAKNWSGRYAAQRSIARAALANAGGCLIPVGRYGTQTTARYVGMDDFGAAVYETLDGPALVTGRNATLI